MDENVISKYQIVKDRYGKKHRVYSVRFKDLQTVTEFTQKYAPDGFAMYAMAPVLDEDGNVEYKADGSMNFDNGFVDDLYDMIDLALDHRETREQIDEWLDFETAQEIIMVFLGMSELKKKLM